MRMDKVRAWHFLPTDGKTANRNRRKVEAGKTYSCRGPIVLCENAMHGSRRIIDALYYAPGPIVELVDIWGDVVEQSDKLGGRHRECLWMTDISDILHEFACRCAEDALRKCGIKDKHSWAAIEAKRKWLRGEIADKELSAAWSAARSAQ
jgi:hypothetical protein